MIFAVIAGAAVLFAAGYVAWAALGSERRSVTRPADSSALRLATARPPFVVFQHVARDEHYAEIAVAPV
ncbi:MAG TPA: hypothetical protein VFL41_08545, partial [Gaiellaceae bacterium]|nr:hypothetical protein [Gaiellaceae bacterium]